MTVASFTSPGSWSWSPPVSSPSTVTVKRVSIWGSGGAGSDDQETGSRGGNSTCTGTVNGSAISMLATGGYPALKDSLVGGGGGSASGGNSINAAGSQGGAGSNPGPLSGAPGGNSGSASTGEHGTSNVAPGGGGSGYFQTFGGFPQTHASLAGGGGGGCCESVWSNVEFSGTLSGTVANIGFGGVHAQYGTPGKVEVEYNTQYVLAPTQASYSLSGQLLTLTWIFGSYFFNALQGAYSYSGFSTIIDTARLLTAAQGSLTLTGKSIVFKAARLLSAAVGSFVLTGYDVVNNLFNGIFAATGHFVLSGQATFVGLSRVFAPVAGIYHIIGQSTASIWNVFAPVYVRNKDYILSRIRSTPPTLDD